jgi:2-methylisocitrate lyase-like PEP mutase family enzyme
VTDQLARATRFRALHEGDPFVIANPWDAGSARMLEALGFAALATTSSGFAFTLGRRDGEVTLDEACAHVAALATVTTLPISADLELGYGVEPAAAAEAIARIAAAGAVGASIEDWDPSEGIFDRARAAERIAAAAEVAHALPLPFMLTARAENLIRDVPDLDDTIARLQAYENAGADVLFAPGLGSIDAIRAVCSSVDRPVNVLARASLALEEIFAAGAQRVSVGGALTRVALGAAAEAASALRAGDLARLATDIPLDRWLD